MLQRTPPDYASSAAQTDTNDISGTNEVMHLNIVYGNTSTDIKSLNESGSMVSSNSWTQSGLAASAADFVSLSINQITNARSPDGSLPVITLMHPVPGDQLTGLGCFIVPPAPTNLAVTARSGQAGLSWAVSPNATAYNVYRSTTNGGPYSVVAWGVTSACYIDTNLTNDANTYYYVVTAVNPGDESADSAQVSVVPFAGPLIGTMTISNWNVVANGTGGSSGWSYYIMVASNLVSPQWIPVATNQFDAGGNFAFTNIINPLWPQSYYRLQLP
jgi:hypothetical protein